MTINFTTLFTNLGKGIHVLEEINTARGTTIPTELVQYQDQFNSGTLLMKGGVIPGSNAADASYRSGGSSAASGLKTTMENVVIETVDADVTLSSKTITAALTELVRQMDAGSKSVDASAVTAPTTTVTGNGDGVLVTSTKRADGLVNGTLLAEIIRLECTSDSTPATASFTAAGEKKITDKLSELWPGGSGVSTAVSAIDAVSSLIGNGDFDDFDDLANDPDEWITSVGAIGTTTKSTAVEVQTLTVSGSPSAGTYVVHWTNEAGKAQTTAPIAYDANASTLQAAMRLLVGLEAITISDSGVTPNYTHTITFTGVVGDLAQITATENTTGGTYTPATTTTGSNNAYVGRALEIDSDGAELTTFNRAVSLDALKQYAFNLWAKTDSAPAAGVITVDLVDGIGGSVINDAAGTANSFTIDCTALTTSFVAKNGTFRTPKVLPPVVYLRIRVSTAISNTSSVYLDHSALALMTSLYSGGPQVSIFSGAAPFTAGNSQSQTKPDFFTITTTNDRAGEFEEWFERLFDMASKGLLLPSNAGGSETVNDALII